MKKEEKIDLIFLVLIIFGTFIVTLYLVQLIDPQEEPVKIDTLIKNQKEVIIKIDSINKIKDAEIIKVESLNNDSTLELFYQLISK